MPLTINTKIYKPYRQMADESRLAGPLHSMSSNDLLAIRRVFPKPVKGFLGVARPGVKMTRTCTLADGTKKDAILDLGSSLPVGMTAADILAVKSDLIAFLGTSEADELFTQLDINVA